MMVRGMRWAGAAAMALALGGSVTAFTRSAAPSAQQVALFAGGCFWSMEKAFDGLPGVLET
ncbi:MAG TPA: peptide-methionine (S)-S-oxide reductase, partial [Gemmatimonadales bacterium]|nr:peptide-methionine (S)-S-oxide reductase [Gemmatimonadales bacterium]